MSGPVTLDSVDQLIQHPLVQNAEVLELCICDAVHFLLVTPQPVFELIESRLCQRDPGLFRGFAEVRGSMEKSNRGSTIRDKVDYCCVKKSEWVPERQILYSMELEVWMEISYPNPWALKLYQSALKLGKKLHIPKQGPFTDLFHKMLLQKNGFERLDESGNEGNRVQVFIGSQVSLPSDSLHLLPDGPGEMTHPVDRLDALSAKAMTGVFLRDHELQSFRNPDPDPLILHNTAFHLIGPTVLLFLQSLNEYSFPIAFSGMGSGFLTTLCESLKHYWPWIPDMANIDSAEIRLSLFPGKGSSMSLFPDPEGQVPSLLSMEDFDPSHLLLPPVELFLEAFVKGKDAAQLQGSTADFITQYARISRGLHLPVPTAPIIEAWRHALLSPSGEFLGKFSHKGCLPGFSRSLLFLRNLSGIKAGAWPTGSYLNASSLSRTCMRIWAPDRVQGILAAKKRNRL